MAKTIAQLHTEAQTIRDATITGENTATRVGGCIDDVVEYIDEVGGVFASGEEVGDVSVFDDENDLTGKTDAQKALMIPDGKVIENMLYTQSAGGVVDITALFTTFTDGKGVLRGGALSDANTNYAYSNIVELPPLAKRVQIRIPRRPSSASNIGVALYNSDSGYLSENCLGGARSTSSGSATQLMTQLVTLNVPEGATHIATSWYSTQTIADNIGQHTLNPFLCEVEVDVLVPRYATRQEYEDVENKISDIVSAESRAETIMGRIAIYNQSAAMRCASSTFNETTFAPFIKSEVTGKRVCVKNVLPRVVGAGVQGGAIYGDLLICASTTGNVLFVNMKKGKRVQWSYQMISETSHFNAAFFGTEFYDAGDNYPIIYFSAGDYPIYGYRITGTEGNFELTLVQTINLPPTADTGFNKNGANAYLYNGSLFVFNTKTGDSSNYWWLKFPMPTLSMGSVVTLDYNSRQEITTGVYTFSHAIQNTTQSGYVDANGVFFCTYYYGIFAVDLVNGTLLNTLNLRNAVAYEYETCFVHNGDLYVVALNRNMNEVDYSPTVEILYVELRLT